MQKLASLLLLAVFLIIIPAQSALAFAISPGLIEISGNRGETIQQKITVVNSKQTEQTFFLDTLKFTARDESGSPQFIKSEDDNTELPSWISFQNRTVVISANSWSEIPFTIAIPNDIASGGYYAAITVSETPSDVVASNNTTIQAKTAALVFLTINGETKIDGALLDFNVNPINTNQIFGTYKYRIQNQGSVHFSPQGKIIFKDIFGRTVYSLDANEQDGKVLPDSTRNFEGIFGKENGQSFLKILKHQFSIFSIGPITAQLEINLGENTPTFNASETFFYIPWEMLLILFLTVFLVIFVYSTTKKKNKKQKMCG